MIVCFLMVMMMWGGCKIQITDKKGMKVLSLYGILTTKIPVYASQDILSPNQLNGLVPSLFML